MSFGAGYGLPFGGGHLIPLSEPVSEVGGDPVTFDFSDDPDGPLPGNWEFLALTDDGAVITGTTEPNPDTYFRVANGLGWWRYNRAPVTGVPFVERGVAASPRGIVEGRNYEVAVAFVPPTRLLDASSDAFMLEIIVGVRANDDLTSYIGARARAEWVSGTWTVPVSFDLIRAAGAAPSVLAAASFDHGPDPTDPWNAGEHSEVRVSVRGSRLEARLSWAQARLVIDPAPGGESSKILIAARVYEMRGTAIGSFPALAGIQLRTLRDIDRLGPPPQHDPRHEDMEAPQLPMMRLPLADLVERGFFVRAGARTYRATQDVTTDVQGVGNTFPEGTLVRAVEPIERQTFVPVVVDLAAIRNARSR